MIKLVIFRLKAI